MCGCGCVRAARVEVKEARSGALTPGTGGVSTPAARGPFSSANLLSK